MSTEIHISKIKPRRGTDDQRRSVVFDQGELIHTLDTKRLYVGNGSLSGGIATSNKFHPPITNFYSLSELKAEIGDIVSLNSIFYQLTANPYSDASNWGDVSLKFDEEFSYDDGNTISITLSGLSANKINPDSITNGLTIKDSRLQLEYNTSFFDLSTNNHLSLKDGSITETELLSSSLGDGLSGGNGEKIGLKIDPNYLTYTSTGNLTLTGSSLSSEGNRIFPLVNNVGVLSTLDAKEGDLAVINNLFYQLTALLPSSVDDWAKISPENGSIFHEPVASYEALSTITTAIDGDFTTINSKTYRLLGTPATDINNWIDVGVKSYPPIFIDDSGYIGLSGVALSSTQYGSYASTQPISSVNFIPYLDDVSIGDVVQTTNSKTYQLTGGSPVALSNWADIGLKPVSPLYLNDSGYLNLSSSSPVIYDALSCKDTLNSSSPLSSLFQGSPTQQVDGRIPGIEITRFEAVSSNGLTTTNLTLSSSGFITVEGSIQTVSGKTVDRFAIPIFTF